MAVRGLLGGLHGDPSTRIVEEMGIWSGTVRIDVAVINGELSGFELKSDKDTLARLPAQAEYYSRVFDRITLVVGTKHANQALRLIPLWWGVIQAETQKGSIKLSGVRDAQKNPNVDPFLLAQLLWKEEALSILDSRGLAKGWRSKPVKVIHQRLSLELPLDELSQEVRSRLKARREWLRQSISSK